MTSSSAAISASSSELPKGRLSRPPMLPHSMSLGHLPGPSFNPMPSGQRSVPATDALARLALGSGPGEGTRTPVSEGVRTPGVVGERVRRDSFEPWSTTPEDMRVSTPDTLPPGSGIAAGRRSTVTFEEGLRDSSSGSALPSAALADLRRNSIARTEGAGSPSGRPPLNRAPGSRDSLHNSGALPTAASRKGLGIGGPPLSGGGAGDRGLGFSIAQSSIPETEAVDSRMYDRTGSGRMGSASLLESDNVSFSNGQTYSPNAEAALRRASQPAFVPFPGSGGSALADPLVAGMTNLGLGERGPLAGLRGSGALNHRQSLPTPYLQSGGAAATSGLGASGVDPGWNPYYAAAAAAAAAAGSPYLSPTQVDGGSTYPGSSGFDPRRDSGYGPSPPHAAGLGVAGLDLRRASYSPNFSQQPLVNGSQLRRSQSAWHIHDAFSNGNAAAAAAAAAATGAGRHASFSYAPPGVGSQATGWPSSPYGSPQVGYSGNNLPSPSLVAMDAPSVAAGSGGALFGAASPLLAQQHLINEARRQSLARQSFDLGQSLLMNPFGLGYAMPSSAQAPGFSPGLVGSVRGSPEAGRGVSRSPILDEFRANKHRRWELRDMLGHIVEFAGDQLGSRHIQSKLDTASADEKELVFAEIYPNVLQLSMDVFANYVVQKFFEQGNQAQKAQLADALRGHVLQLSLQMYGCRVVQKALEHVLVDQQQALVKELESDVMQCAKDQNANHVLQRSLELVDPATNRFITQAFVGQAFSLATHPYGCRVLQRVFENVPGPQSRPLLDELHRYAHNLMTDSYANYVAQWIIEDGPPEDASLMINKIRGQTLLLSKHKFASNVVEKAILKANDEELRSMVDEILAPRPDGASTIGIMLKDAFANFPLQKFLLVAREPQRSILFQETAAQLAHMRKYSLSYGKYLVAIEKLISNEFPGPAFLPLPMPQQHPAIGSGFS